MVSSAIHVQNSKAVAAAVAAIHGGICNFQARGQIWTCAVCIR